MTTDGSVVAQPFAFSAVVRVLRAKPLFLLPRHLDPVREELLRAPAVEGFAGQGCALCPVGGLAGEKHHGARVDLASNDYLGFAKLPLPGASRSSAGASGLVGGYLGAHLEAERALCEWLDREAALLFSSGWAANVGVIGALVGGRRRAARLGQARRGDHAGSRASQQEGQSTHRVPYRRQSVRDGIACGGDSQLNEQLSEAERPASARSAVDRPGAGEAIATNIFGEGEPWRLRTRAAQAISS